MRLDMQAALNLPDNPLVECACGRTANADMMRDVRPVKALIGTTADYLCDSCIESLHRTERLSREAFYTAHAAPRAAIAKMAKVDRAYRAMRNAI